MKILSTYFTPQVKAALLFATLGVTGAACLNNCEGSKANNANINRFEITADSSLVKDSLAIVDKFEASTDSSLVKENTAIIDKFETSTESASMEDNIAITEEFKDKLDLSKPNLPIIHKGDKKVTYTNLDGDTITFKLPKGSEPTITSLYKAIQNLSTEESPNITDIGTFYADIDKTIALSHPVADFVTRKLNTLFNLYTDPSSDEGRTLTVKEYTNMMAAWSALAK